jgi:hypothetical protein
MPTSGPCVPFLVSASVCSDDEEAIALAAESIADVTHNKPSEMAAAVFSAIGLVTQISLLAIVTMQKASSTMGAGSHGPKPGVTS